MSGGSPANAVMCDTLRIGSIISYIITQPGAVLIGKQKALLEPPRPFTCTPMARPGVGICTGCVFAAI